MALEKNLPLLIFRKTLVYIMILKIVLQNNSLFMKGLCSGMVLNIALGSQRIPAS
uniref:Uncharacterized protein n=2 Tax=Weeksellaceae TaxID=2762318 RepID=A0A455ZES2_9FLAO|nr:TPA_exp: hypothetical protein [Elizabethkingia anophelis]